MYIYAKGAENTKSAPETSTRYKVLTIRFRKSRVAMKEVIKNSNISTQNFQIIYIYKRNMQNFRFLALQTPKHMIFSTTIDNKEIAQSEQIAQQ